MDNQTPVKELELYIIRHGQSKGNAGFDGKTDLTEKERHDSTLTQKGIEQANKAGRYLSEVEFDAVFSSGMLRAAQTATEIMKYQKKAKILNILPILCEMMVAHDYDGATMEELKEINPEAVLAPDVDPDSPMLYYNAEDDAEGTFERAEKVLTYLREHFSNGEKIAVVSHAAFITYLVFSLMGYSKKVPVFDIDFNNTSITKVKLYKEGTNKYGDIVFEVLNDTAHLKENGKI